MGATGNIGYATFITPMIEDDMVELEDYLRTHVEPHFDEHSIVKCQETFRFDEIRTSISAASSYSIATEKNFRPVLC